MKPIGNDRSGQFILRQLLPDVIRVAGQELVGGIAKVSRQACASVDRFLNLSRTGCRMPNGHQQATLNTLPDKSQPSRATPATG